MKTGNHQQIKALAAVNAGLLLAALTSAFGLSVTLATDDSVDEINVTVPVSCTFSNTTTDGSYTVSLLPGNYDDEVGSTNIQVFCNDNSGFSIYAIGYSNDEYGNTDMVSSSASIPNIVTGTATSGNTSNWAMKIAKVAGAYAPTIIGEDQEDDEDFTDFHEIPDTYTKVATFASVTDGTVGSSLTTTYLVYANPIQAPGTFTGKVKYTLVHPEDERPADEEKECPGGYICYWPDANDAMGSMSNQEAEDDTLVTLYPSNFSREGYGFAGWSTTFDYSDSTGFYGPMESITTPADLSTEGLSLYAHWVSAETGVTMQTFNPTASPYSTKAIGSVIALKDGRDNDTYAVAKLADGKWWMIENLRLDNNTTDNSTGELAQGYALNFAGLANPESPWANNTTVANSLYSTDGSTIKTISGNNLATRLPRYNNQNTANRVSGNNYNVEGNVYSYGNYYSWPAAVADTDDYNTNNVSVSGTSICPNNWRLPIGGNDNNALTSDYRTLSVATIGLEPNETFDTDRTRYNGIVDEIDVGAQASKDLRSYPTNLIYSGYVRSSDFFYQGERGYYLTSTNAYSNDHAYDLYILNEYVNPGNGHLGKVYGSTVRCLFDD